MQKPSCLHCLIQDITWNNVISTCCNLRQAFSFKLTLNCRLQLFPLLPALAQLTHSCNNINICINTKDSSSGEKAAATSSRLTSVLHCFIRLVVGNLKKALAQLG